MKISSAVPIVNASQQSSDLGLPFDIRPFLEADLNYYLGVGVITREDRPVSAFSVPQALLSTANFHENFGDCFISGTSKFCTVRKQMLTAWEVSSRVDNSMRLSLCKYQTRKREPK